MQRREIFRWEPSFQEDEGQSILPQTARFVDQNYEIVSHQPRMKNAPMDDIGAFFEWTGGESNPRHQDFQSCALPTELPVHCRGA